MMAIKFIGKACVLFACTLLVAGFASGQEKVVSKAAKIKAGADISANARGAIVTNKTNPITDLVLIYEAGTGRQSWTMDDFRPYVYREVEGKFEWLFDGFLFIDFLAPSGARLCPITHHKDATKQDWQELMEHYFQDGQNIAALETNTECDVPEKSTLPALVGVKNQRHSSP